jgi:hypothetical protein
MKLVTEHLADAANFERWAEAESDPGLKKQLLEQAAAYRKLRPGSSQVSWSSAPAEADRVRLGGALSALHDSPRAQQRPQDTRA